VNSACGLGLRIALIGHGDAYGTLQLPLVFEAGSAVAGMTGLGLTSHLVLGVYALYTQWHGPTLTTSWLWPARPPHDLGAAICAGLIFALGMAAITMRGARDPVDE
jgi:hypothetical protein